MFLNKDKFQFAPLKNNNFLQRQLVAGKVLSSIQKEIFKIIKTKSNLSNLSSLNSFAHDFILKNNCTPTFLNYNGFPSSICASLNKELVHGLGNRNIQIKEGDLVTIDIGVTFEGAIADCAVTYLFGSPKNDKILKLLESCQNALIESIKIIEVGKKIGEIGHTIFEIGKSNNFGVIENYGGHGIDENKLHADPFISNKSRKEEGITIQPGLSIAIEPMFVINQNIHTKTALDKWTVFTQDISVHFEHTVTFDENGNKHIITEHGISVKDFV